MKSFFDGFRTFPSRLLSLIILLLLYGVLLTFLPDSARSRYVTEQEVGSFTLEIQEPAPDDAGQQSPAVPGDSLAAEFPGAPSRPDNAGTASDSDSNTLSSDTDSGSSGVGSVSSDTVSGSGQVSADGGSAAGDSPQQTVQVDPDSGTDSGSGPENPDDSGPDASQD